MLFIIIIAVFAVLAILTGGSLSNLKNIRFKHAWLVFMAAAIKIITNSDLRYVIDKSGIIAPKLYMAALLLVLIFIFFNINIRGLFLVGLGLFSNFLAIVSNSGFMPVRRDYLVMTATPEEIEMINQGLPVYNHIASGPGTKFYFLSDIILMPEWVMITRVISVGDIILTIGGVIFIWTSLKNYGNRRYCYSSIR